MRYFQPAMMLKYTVVLCLLWITSACGTGKKKMVEYDQQGHKYKVYYVSRKHPELLVDRYKVYYPNGREMESAKFIKGKLHGPRILSYPDGMPMQEEYYVAGTYHGPFRSWFENGQIKQAGMYENGKMTGQWKFYYAEPQGALKEIVTFKDNAENGPFIEYHKNGKIAAEGNYLNELEHGLVKVYDDSGRLIKRIMYNNGRPTKYEELHADQRPVADSLPVSVQ